MEMILRLKSPGMLFRIPGKQIAAGGILAGLLICLCLYAEDGVTEYTYAGFSDSAYSETMAAELPKRITKNGDMELPLQDAIARSGLLHESVSLDGLVSELPTVHDQIRESTDIEVYPDTVKPEPVPVVNITAYGNGGIPAMTEISGRWDTFSIEDIEVPDRPGKLFDGWYVDEACTEPYVKTEEGADSLHLYAGWADFPGFTANDAGYVTGYTDKTLVMRDGLLVLPSYESCLGIERYAFGGIEEEVLELYVPANIRYIAPGAFNEMSCLLFIEVSPDNPVFYCEDGILYNKDGSVAVYPKGRE